MADAYYYQDNTGQVIGPLAPAALKQLANEGVIHEATPVRKGEQGAWYQASTIAGLVPPRPARQRPPEAEVFAEPEPDHSERARQTFRKAEEHADKVAATFWFLDLKFEHFFTPKLAGLVWAVFVCYSVLAYFFSALESLAMLGRAPLAALSGIVLGFVGLLLAVILSRVLLEALLALFRIAEHLANLKHLENLKPSENRSL